MNSYISRANSDDDDTSPYNYTPSEYVAIIFLALFGVSTALHLFQAVRYRIWWLLPTAVLAGIGEIAGWSGRLWSSINVLNNNAFLMQITSTIIAPTPLLAANFIIFGVIIRTLGQQYSRLTPKLYSAIFVSCDIVALVVQGTGGGIASSADTDSGTNAGGNIMLGGIVFQLVSLVVFITLSAEFYWRFATDRPVRPSAISENSVVLSRTRNWTKDIKLATVGLGFSCLVIFIRSIYRTIELADGWNGRIISTQVYFNVLDGAMIVLAMYTLNFFHPGRLLDIGVRAKSHAHDDSSSPSLVPKEKEGGASVSYTDASQRA